VKSDYERFCSSHDVPLQLQPWWLDAVCGPQNWGACIARDQGRNTTGVLPWYRTRRFGLPVIIQPPFTTYSGPWLEYPQNPDFKLASRYAFEKKTYTDLLLQLPRTALFKQNFRPEITNHLPFYWEGFSQTTRYTYIMADTRDMQRLESGFKNTLRTDLRKAESATRIFREDDQADLVFDLNRKSFERKAEKQPYRLNTFQNLHAALLQRGQAACFIARDRASGIPHAGLYLAFDTYRASILMTGMDPTVKTSCGVYGLFLEAIRHCGTHGLSLDFEGSMHPAIEHSFRAFGAQLTPYHQVWKYRPGILQFLKP
jgi:hypothetical protein